MKIIQSLLTPNKYSRPKTELSKVKKVVVHYTGNPMSTAKNNRDYFNNAPNHHTYVSSHYVVGLQGEVIQCIPETEWAYCSNQANGYSISIETCHPDVSGKFNAVTEQSLVELVADICKRNKLNPQTDVIRHYDVTGKRCPKYYVDYPQSFTSFKNRVKLAIKGNAPVVPKPTEKIPIANFTNYTVKANDSFWKIASKQMGSGLKYLQLAKYNGLKITSTIHAGQTLKIPK